MSLDSTDPSDIANASRCFASCVPMGEQQALRTYLLTQFGNAVTPPCVTPTAPTSAGAKSIGNTTILMSWSQPPNSGSFIKNYIVYWGTTSGVYTNNSGLLPATPRLYTISGLATGTTYFWTVQAVAFSGCNSAVSSEKSATTTGSPASNALLQNLTSYWKFDVDSSPYADSVGGNPLTGHGTNAAVPGIINTGLNVGLGGAFASAANVAGGDFDPANTSFSLSLWVSSSLWSQAGSPFYIVLNNGNPGSSIATGPYYLYIDHALQQLICGMFDSGVNQFQQVVSGAFPSNNTFHHIVLSFDAAAKTFKSYYDGALAASSVTTTGGLYQGAGGSFVLSTTALPNFIIDEVGMWHKALTATDVGVLYNAGAGLPLANFGA